MLEGLKTYLKNVDQKKAENKLRNDKQRMDQKLASPQIQARKQRDRENYFLGASFRKLMELTGLFEQTHDLGKLCSLVATARFTQIMIQEQNINTEKYERLLAQSDPEDTFKKAVQQILEDPRNPYIKKWIKHAYYLAIFKRLKVINTRLATQKIIQIEYAIYSSTAESVKTPYKALRACF